MDGQQRTGSMQTHRETMAPLEPDQCQACEAYMKETALLQRSLSVLRKKLEELYEQEKGANRREQETYNREQETQEQLCRALGRERDVLCLLNEVKKENKFLRSALDTKSINFVQSVIGEPRSANQMNSMAPQTPSRPGHSRNTAKAHSPKDLAPLKIATGGLLSVDPPSGTDLASTLTTAHRAVESTDSMSSRTLSSANRTDVGEPIEGDTRLLSGEADTQPGRVVTHLIPGENKEQGQGQETEAVTMVECTVMDSATDELHVLSAAFGPSPNEVEMTLLDGSAECLHEAPPVSTLAEGLWAAGCESVGIMTSDNQIEIGNLLKGDAGQVSGQMDAEVEDGGGTQLIHCDDEEQGQGHERNVVGTGERAVAGNIVDGVHDMEETSGPSSSDADTVSIRACTELLNDMLPVFTSEDGHREAEHEFFSNFRTGNHNDPQHLLKCDIISKHDQAVAQLEKEGEKALVNCKGKEHEHQLMHDVEDVIIVEDVTSLSVELHGLDEGRGHCPVDAGFASSPTRGPLIVLSSAAPCSDVESTLDLQGSNLQPLAEPLEVVGVRVQHREDGKQVQGVQDAVMNTILASGSESNKEPCFFEVSNPSSGNTGTPPESWSGLEINIAVSETSGSPAAEFTALSSTSRLTDLQVSANVDQIEFVSKVEEGLKIHQNAIQCEGRVLQSSDAAGEPSGHIQDPKTKLLEDVRGGEETTISKGVNSGEIEHDLGAGTAISCASQEETLKPLLEDILLQHAAENQRTSDNNESTKRRPAHHNFVQVELSSDDEDDFLLGLNTYRKRATSLSKKRVLISSHGRPMPIHVTTSTEDNAHAMGEIEDIPALSSDRGDVVEGSQHRKRKPVNMVLSSDDEDSPGTCPDLGEGYTLLSRKRKLFLSSTDDLGSPNTNFRARELGEGTSLQVPETRIRKDSDMNDANYPGAAADSEPEEDVMLEASVTPGNLKRLNRVGKVHESQREEERAVTNTTEIRKSARLKHKISGNGGTPGTDFDNGKETPTKRSKGHSRARKSYGIDEGKQDIRRRSARLNQNSVEGNPPIVSEANKDLRRSRRARKVSEMHKGENDSDELVLEKDGDQRSARLKQQSSRRRNIPIAEFARSCQDNEDEVESDEENSDSFIADSDEVVSECPDREDLSGATAASPKRQKRKKKKYMGPVNPSDSDSSDRLIGRLFRSARDKEPSPTANNGCISESSDDTKIVNLLRTENDDNEEEDEKDDDSLSGFIVHESSHSEDSVSNGSDEGSNSSSTGGSSIMGDTPSRREVLRKRNQLDWEYEADMLAAMANDSELALQAVCALYHQQTEDEKRTKDSLYANKRGFDKFHATRASKYAEFLTAGDLAGTLKKSAKELEQHFPGALKFCHQIAAHHSKQLFEIYETYEDPLWSKRIL